MSIDLEYNEVDNGFMDVRPLDLVTPPSQCTQKDHGVYFNLSRFMLISYRHTRFLYAIVTVHCRKNFATSSRNARHTSRRQSGRETRARGAI